MIYSYGTGITITVFVTLVMMSSTNCYRKSRCASFRLFNYSAWIASKVFFVTSFGFESGKISVHLLVLDLPSHVNSFQFLVCAHVLLRQDNAPHVISQMDTCAKVRLFSPPCCFCDYRVRNMFRSLLPIHDFYSWMSVIHLFVIAERSKDACETTAVYAFQKSIQLFDAPCYYCNVLDMFFLLIHHDYHCADVPWSIHLLILLE